jgi:hypothetical protein
MAGKKKRVQALPFLHAFCPAKSLTRGEENIPQTMKIKQSPCQPGKGRQIGKSCTRWPDFGV